MELQKPIDAFSQNEMADFIEAHQIPCPTCGKHDWTDIRQFNLMFKTFQGSPRTPRTPSICGPRPPRAFS